ncbi:MAG: ribonuclease R [Planctomycetaceae bacterium]|nr:ribonuclease R [Planctomycetaceae bacterium]
MTHDEIKNGIIDIVTQTGYKPVKPKGLVPLLGLDSTQIKEVRRVVRQMIRDEELVYGSRHLLWPGSAVGGGGQVERKPDRNDFSATPRRFSYRNDEESEQDWLEEVQGAVPPKTSYDRTASCVGQAESAAKPLKTPERLIVGTFRPTDYGNGFVRPRDLTDPGDRASDIFIAAEDTRDAASGDIVAVELAEPEKRRKRDRSLQERGPQGRIVKILDRETSRFVGTYDCDDVTAVVMVDAKMFRDPVDVGDPSACPARPGDKVVIDMVRFPTYTRHGEGVVVEVLGPHGTPELDTQLIIRQYGLPTEFSEEVQEAARREAAAFSETIPSDRYDATEEITLTIDPADARDFDDAISLERREKDHWRLGVHIADVSHFVKEGTPLDNEARQRGTSVYLPDKVIPMLPEILSNALASLQPQKLRFAKSVWIEFTPEGIPVDVEIKRTVIRSDARLNYDEVTAFLANPKPWLKKWGRDVHALLGRMTELAMILRDRRIRRGAIEMTMPEIKLILDDDGHVKGTKLVEHTRAYQVIEEFMLAANEAVAQFLASRGLPFLRRIHALPSYRKMKLFAQFIRSLGIRGVTADALMESRFEIQKLLERVAGTPEQQAVNYALLRSMQKAVYSPDEEGHYALASPCYCHFTSPIRRYPDLTIHRLLERLLQKQKPKHDLRALFLLGEECSQAERNAEEAERELVKLKLINFLMKKIGTQMVGTITGVEQYGFYVQGEEIPAEGLIRLKTLAGHYYFDRDTHTLTGNGRGETFRLGDRLVIEVLDANPDTRRIDFKFLRRLAPGEQPDDLHGKTKKVRFKEPKYEALPSEILGDDLDDTGGVKARTPKRSTKSQSKRKGKKASPAAKKSSKKRKE